MNKKLEDLAKNAPEVLARIEDGDPTRPFFEAVIKGTEAVKDYYAQRIDRFLSLDRGIHVKQGAEGEPDLTYHDANDRYGDKVLARGNAIVGARVTLNVIKQFELVSPEVSQAISQFSANQWTFAHNSKGAAFTTVAEIEYIVDTLNQVRNDLTGELF